MRLSGRLPYVVGPVVTLATAAVVFLINRYVVFVPAPGTFPALAMIFAAYWGGAGPGLLSLIIASCSLFVLQNEAAPHWVAFDLDPMSRFALYAGIGLLVVGLVSASRARAQRILARERASRERAEESNRALLRLRAALDQIEHGVVLLDENLNAQFINRAYRRMWNLPDHTANAGPNFAELIRRAQADATFGPPTVESEDNIAARVATVHAGDERTRDLRRSDGRVIRVHCSRLPEGGRMLSYVDVTDLVNHADQLERLATTDTLTEAYNRRHFLFLAEKEWARFDRHDSPLALLMLDIDNFKAINDRFGHVVGDSVIRHVATLCREETRTSDILARLGGEEFALLLPETDLRQACIIAERLRVKVAAEPTATSDITIPFTISIGLAQATIGTADIGDLLKAADDALYEAKRGGRNCIVCAGSQSSDKSEAAA